MDKDAYRGIVGEPDSTDLLLRRKVEAAIDCSKVEPRFDKEDVAEECTWVLRRQAARCHIQRREFAKRPHECRPARRSARVCHRWRSGGCDGA